MGNDTRTAKEIKHDFCALYPIKNGWAVRTWLIQNDDCGTVVQASLSGADDHVVFSCFGSGLDVETAQRNALYQLRAEGVDRE